MMILHGWMMERILLSQRFSFIIWLFQVPEFNREKAININIRRKYSISAIERQIHFEFKKIADAAIYFLVPSVSSRDEFDNTFRSMHIVANDTPVLFEEKKEKSAKGPFTIIFSKERKDFLR